MKTIIHGSHDPVRPVSPVPSLRRAQLGVTGGWVEAAREDSTFPSMKTSVEAPATTTWRESPMGGSGMALRLKPCYREQGERQMFHIFSSVMSLRSGTSKSSNTNNHKCPNRINTRVCNKNDHPNSEEIQTGWFWIQP